MTSLPTTTEEGVLLVTAKGSEYTKRILNILKKLGIQVTTTSPEDAVGNVVVHSYRAVLVDLAMDEGTLRLVDNLAARAPVIVFSERSDARLMQAMARGAVFCYANGTINESDLTLALKRCSRDRYIVPTNLLEAAVQSAARTDLMCKLVEAAVNKLVSA